MGSPVSAALLLRQDGWDVSTCSNARRTLSPIGAPGSSPVRELRRVLDRLGLDPATDFGVQDRGPGDAGSRGACSSGGCAPRGPRRRGGTGCSGYCTGAAGRSCRPMLRHRVSPRARAAAHGAPGRQRVRRASPCRRRRHQGGRGCRGAPGGGARRRAGHRRRLCALRGRAPAGGEARHLGAYM